MAMRSLVWLLAMLAGAPAMAGAADYRPPRTTSGVPDLQGLWTNSSMTVLERPAQAPAVILTEAQAAQMEARRRAARAKNEAPVDPQLGALPETEGDVGQQQTEQGDPLVGFARIHGQVRAAWIVDPPDGKLPYRPEVAARRAAAGRDRNADDPEARPPTERCLMGMTWPNGPPMMNAGYNANYRFVQTPDHLAIVAEMNHDARIIPIGGAFLPDPIRPWMGSSVGRWEGEALVVETRGLHPIQLARGRVALSDRARIVERFRRIAERQILYEFTVDDPATYTRPWRGEMVFNRTDGPMYEFACHEGNYSLPNVLAGARAQDGAAAKAAPSAPAAPH